MSLKNEPNLNQLVIDLSWSGSLFEPSSDVLCEKLEAILDSVQSEKTVFLRAQSELHDYSKSWLFYIKHEALWEELFSRLVRWSSLLVRIYQSRSRWVFLYGGDVIGSWWELALACHVRIATNPYSKIGLPDLLLSRLPALGGMCLQADKFDQDLSKLKNGAVKTSKEAHQSGLIDLCFVEDDWLSDAGIKLFAMFSSDKRLLWKRKEVIENKRSEVSELSRLSAKREDLTVVRAWKKFSHISTLESWRREKDPTNRFSRFAELQAASVDRFLSKEYHSWLSRRVLRYRFGYHDGWWVHSSKWIVFDVSAGFPPVELVKKLIDRRKHLVFFDLNAERLGNSLRSLRANLERQISDKTALAEIWSRFINWSVGRNFEPNIPILRFFRDDYVRISSKDSILELYRLSGNHSQSIIGWHEVVSERSDAQEKDSLNELLELLANGGVRATQHWYDSVSDGSIKKHSLALVLRFVLLEFVLRYLKRTRKSLTFPDFLKLLRDVGWGFCSSLSNWQDLVREHSSGLSPAIVQKYFSGDLLYQKVTHDSLIKLQYSEKGEGLPRTRSAEMVSRIMVTFGTSLAKELVVSGYVSSRDEADLLVSLAWGFPSHVPLGQDYESELKTVRLSFLGQLVSKIQQQPGA